MRRGLALAAALLLVVTVAQVAVGPTAGATSVSVATEAEYRAALTTLSADTTGPHTITLTADITLDDGTAPTYSGSPALTIEGLGRTIDAGDTSRILVVSSNAALTLQNVILRGGYTWTHGGAVQAQGPVTVTSSWLTDNTADGDGGAIWTWGAVTLTEVALTENLAGMYGGGVRAGSLTVDRSRFEANGAQYGGALWGGTVDVTSSGFAGNTGRVGGGAIDSAGTATIANSTIAGNTAFSQGGGVRTGGDLVLDHTTLAGNLAPAGASAHVGGGLETARSVLAEPLGDGGNCVVAGTTVSGGHNWADDTSCGLTGTGDVEDPDGDPLLGTAGDNGGFSPTRLPLTGSPLMDAIPNAACSTTVTTDQRGVTRPQPAGGACDIGAVEVVHTYQPDGWIRRGTQPDVGDDTYNTTGTGQTARATPRPGGTATYWATVENDGDTTDTFRLRGLASNDLWIVRYYRGLTNITRNVSNGTARVADLAPDAYRLIRITVAPRPGTPRGATITRRLTITSTTDTTQLDVVRTITTRS